MTPKRRVVFVHRNGFRKRRLVTPLLDPIVFSASELARLYHMCWESETFYRNFKHTLRAPPWHCHTSTCFNQKVLLHMIALCLFPIAMLETSGSANHFLAQLSFARAFTETLVLVKLYINMVS